MSRTAAAGVIQQQIDKSSSLRALPQGDHLRAAREAVDRWLKYNETLGTQVFGDRRVAEEMRFWGYFPVISPDQIETKISHGEAVLRSWLERLELLSEPSIAETSPDIDLCATTLARLELLARRFPRLIAQLQQRHSHRTTLQVSDEYDLQDLLHALLCLDFDDIRPEEYSPSVAGGNSRLDFLLKLEQVVVEAKMTRAGLDAKALGAELLVDIARYRGHPDCRVLVCLVYDPDGRIANPIGLKRDLENGAKGLQVVVHIFPF